MLFSRSHQRPADRCSLVLAQRGLKEIHSARNTRRLLAEGGHEEGVIYYPVVVATHLDWIASLAFLILSSAPIIWPLIAYYLILQIARYWVMQASATTGRTGSSRCPARPFTEVAPTATSLIPTIP
jgi:hypothetical protein